MNLQIILAAIVLNFLAIVSAFGKSTPAPKVTFTSPCDVQGQHGVDRWTPKTDSAPAPFLSLGVASVTPSQIYQWKGPGPNVRLTRKTETRMPSEQKWFKLTGRVVDLRVEADGDIHIAMRDATGTKIGTVGAEVPVGEKWCKIRQAVFSWTTQKFPFRFKSSKVLTIREHHIVTVT